MLSLQATVSQLQAEVVNLKERVRELEVKLKKDSSNSSRPPSSDLPWKKQTKKKPSSGNAPGGQPGHRGHCRALLPLEQVQNIIEYAAEECDGCGEFLSSNDACGEPQRHQVAELPPIEPTITEHRAYDRRCKRCGTISKRSIPEKETKSAFGPNVQALVGTLASGFHLSRAGLQECMEQIFGLSICVGTIQRMLEDIGCALEAPYNEALHVLRKAPVRYFDETTWYIKNQRGYLWAGVCKAATVFTIAATRGRVVLHRWIGVDALANGYIVTDRYSAYALVPMQRRGICHAHIRRDFQGMTDAGGYLGIIGSAAVTQHEALFKILHDWKSGKISASALNERVEPVKTELKRLLERGVAGGSGMCANLLKHWEAMWTFLSVPEMEPTNNLAERAVRPMVLLRKRSLGTRSAAGGVFTERAQTIIATCRQNGRNALTYMRDAVRAFLDGQCIPKLLPTH